MNEAPDAATDKVIDKVRKLMNTVGRTEEEAQIFAQKAQELLSRYKLDMSDIQFEDFKLREPVDKHIVNWYDHDIKVRRRRIEWIEDLAAFVANAYFCRILVHQGTSYISFVGRKSDAKVAEYVLVTLVRQAEKIADAAYVKYFYECRDKGDVKKARGFRAGFLMGFVHRIAARLQAKKDEMMRDSMALVRFSGKEIDDFMKSFKSSSALTRSKFHSQGYARGSKAADDVNLDGKAVGKATDRPKELR